MTTGWWGKSCLSTRPLLTPPRGEREKHLITAGWSWKYKLPMVSTDTGSVRFCYHPVEIRVSASYLATSDTNLSGGEGEN